MKKLINEELIRIKEIMGINHTVISEGLGSLIKGYYSSLPDFLARIGPTLEGEANRLLGRAPQSMDEIIDAMDRSEQFATNIIRQLAKSDTILADTIATEFMRGSEFLGEWDVIAKGLQSGDDVTRAETIARLERNYGFPSTVIDILKKEAPNVYDFAHDIGGVEKAMKRTAVLRELATLKNIKPEEIRTNPNVVKVLNQAEGVLTETEVIRVLNKKAPTLVELWGLIKNGKIIKNSEGKYRTFEQIIEAADMRPGPELNRILVGMGYDATKWLGLVNTSGPEFIKKWLWRLLIAGLISSGVAMWIVGGPRKFVKAVENIPTTWSTDEGLISSVQFYVNKAKGYENKKVSKVILNSRFTSEPKAVVRFDDNTEVEADWDGTMWVLPDVGSSTKSTSKYENKEDDFKKWMADQPTPLTGTPTIEKNTDGSILGFTLGGKTYFLKSDKSGFE